MRSLIRETRNHCCFHSQVLSGQRTCGDSGDSGEEDIQIVLNEFVTSRIDAAMQHGRSFSKHDPMIVFPTISDINQHILYD
jgi:hypothetical protein